MEKIELIKYWIDSSDRDFITMEQFIRTEKWINEIKDFRKWIKELL